MSDKKGGVGGFFSGLWRAVTWLRISLSNVLFLLIIALVVLALNGGVPGPIDNNTALLLNPVGVVVEEKSFQEPLEVLLGAEDTANREVLLTDVLDAVDAAAADPAISALVLQLDGLRYIGLTKSLEVGESIEAFKLSGKPVVAISDYLSQDQYLLASYADEVYLNPQGGLLLEGYSSFRNYFKGALDKLKIDMNVFVAGENKDAMEPFLRDEMSATNREFNLAWLNALWGQYTAKVEENRTMDVGELDRYIAEYEIRNQQAEGDFALMSLRAGLVDKLLGRADMNQHLVDTVGGADDDGHFRAIDYVSYLGRATVQDGVESGVGEVGIIVASGTILDGEQPAGTIGGDTLAGLIRDARLDSNTQALVLRIDSGGGSAFASEVVRQEILNAKAEGIPIVASMGATAASGGYWIAMDADQIWAMPSTLTGSIGVWSAIPTLERSLAAVGINTDGVATTPLAGAVRLDRSIAPPVKAMLQSHVEHTYANFVQYVAAGRNMAEVDVLLAAEGRVWSGQTALELGLVDHLGGLKAAIAAAADLAGVSKEAYRFIRQPLSPRDQLLQNLAGELAAAGVTVRTQDPALVKYRELLKPVSEFAAFLQHLNDPAGMYTRCLACAAP